jgi:hypothetical protein
MSVSNYTTEEDPGDEVGALQVWQVGLARATSSLALAARVSFEADLWQVYIYADKHRNKTCTYIAIS